MFQVVDKKSYFSVLLAFGTHAAHLAEYITGSKITAINAFLNSFVKGRKLDDDSSMLVKFDNGASGVLFATQVAAGEENNLNIRVYGEGGGLEWRQEEPNTLMLKWLDKPKEMLRTGGIRVRTRGTIPEPQRATRKDI
jgi:predicted dehydrogenase